MLVLSAYKQKLKYEELVTVGECGATLQACFDFKEWDMFRDSSSQTQSSSVTFHSFA